MVEGKPRGSGHRDEGTSPSVALGGPAQRLMAVDSLIDWTALDRFLLWTEADCLRRFGHRPIVLFKALLLKHWFRLRADEFDHDLADRASFRLFVMGDDAKAPPPHASVAAFSRMLRERGLGQDLFNGMERQLSALEAMPPRPSLADLMSAMGVDDPFSFAAEMPPPEWQAVEDAFVALWNDRRGPSGAPSQRDIALSDLRPFECNLIVLRVREAGTDFTYESVGAALEFANGGAFNGHSVAQKARHNHEVYGHPGVQEEVRQAFMECLSEMRPIRLTAYFRAANRTRCQLWLIAAPLVDADTGKAVRIIGAAHIRPLSYR